MVFWAAIVIIVISTSYFNLQKVKLKEDRKWGNGDSETKRQIGQLMAENEQMKERLRNIEELLAQSKDKIDLEYEREQIRLDKQNKFNS
jgi:hypothetical protein